MASIQKLLLLNETLTVASTNGASKSVGSPATSNPIGFLHVTNPNGATTVAAKIQHSPDGVNGWTDFLSFTTTSAGATAEEVVVPSSPSMLGHLRAVVTLGGATMDAGVEIALWIKPAR